MFHAKGIWIWKTGWLSLRTIWLSLSY